MALASFLRLRAPLSAPSAAVLRNRRAFAHAVPLSVRLMSSEPSSHQKQYEFILTSRPAEGVALITLNRPKALNALSTPLFTELNDAVKTLDEDDSVRALVLTGSERAFAAGADIKEMKDKQFSDVFKDKFLESWGLLTTLRKPIIAAVSGYALGGGCELALMCDIILAAPNAVFGQPEINIGVIPGGGGSQRLAHAIGKSRTMEVVLTGRNFSAQEASDWGMVSRVVSENEGGVVKAAVDMAAVIASKSAIAVQAGKEVVNAAFEHTLNEGLRYERRLFHSLFATKDQKEGMAAFAEKRKPTWTHS
ncbi:enoyl-CoA hydratase [Trametes punicea]|nr:enoyl-CoA hydratase [Trametes punicea]